MFDFTHPWFRPLWRRVLLIAITGGWGIVELATLSPGWALMFLALAGYLVWALLIAYAPGPDDREEEK